MARIKPIDRSDAPTETCELLSEVERKLGMVPNVISTMAHSTAVAKGYLDFSDALESGALPIPLREQLALSVSQTNGCNYCLAAHSAIGSSVGLTEDEIRDAREGHSPNRKIETALKFARRIVDRRGDASDDDIKAMRTAGYGDAEIVEVIATVSLTSFTNYLNRLAHTDVDFPPVSDVVSP